LTEAEQVGAILTEARAEGWSFEDGWNTAIRMLMPPPQAAPEVRAELADARTAIIETRPYWEAAWFRQRPDDEVRALVKLKGDERIAEIAPVIEHFDLAELDIEDVMTKPGLVLG
jgi:hypothetical protein